MLLGCANAAALQPSTPLASYSRQSWAMESGLPQNSVQALLQTADGSLWVGTEAGLALFDGSGFRVFDRDSRPALPGNDIRCLLQTGDGALWIGTSEGLARWKGETATAFTTREGLPGNIIRALRSNDRGSVIVTTQNGEAAIEDGMVMPIAPNRHAGPEPELAAALPDGGKAEATSTTVSVTQLGREVRLRVGKELPGSRVHALLADREGSLWIGTNHGLARWIEGKVQLLPEGDPLGNTSIVALLEDREGDLWLGTESDGLQILRDHRFRTLGARGGLSSNGTTAVVEDSAGTLWAGTQNDGLNAVRRNGADRAFQVRTWSVTRGLVSDVILSLAAAPNGDLWVGTPDGLNRIRAGSVATFTSSDGLPDDFIRSLFIDADGSLWIGTRRGLAHWTMSRGVNSRASIQTYTQASGLGSDLVGAIARDVHGDLWVATLAGLSRLHEGKIDNFTTANGLSSDVITALLARADGTLLIGTQDHGWGAWDGHAFFPAIEGRHRAIYAILNDGIGHLWFATENGIARCDTSGMAVTARGNFCAKWLELSAADGLPSKETAINSHPSAWRSRDGQLWFATPNGLVEVDPMHFPVNTLPPPVVLERFVVDDAAQPVQAEGSSLKIPAGHVHFQFDYAGLSFVAPQKVRYRYMLDGFDRGWTDAGTRREAYYTNIPPGQYTFRVQAANNDDVWNTAGADFPFELRSHYYQTLWFYALLLAMLAAAIVLLVKGRLHLAEREFTAVLGERNRIAREIHDTLAQGYAGISVQLEVVAELLKTRKIEAAMERLNQTREHVREGLAEARQSIWALRTQDTDESTLPVKLRRMVELAGTDDLIADFRLFGVYRPLAADIERELLRVAQEAMHNVKQHADAGHLFVQLEYGPEEVALEVRDDGRGGAMAAPAKSAAGHFGLTGMRERAAGIGGRLKVTSEPGTGTTVRLSATAPIDVREQAGKS